MVVKKRKAKKLTWTPAQREVAALYGEGKGFQEIVAAGYSKDMTSRVGAALNRGDTPPEAQPEMEQQSVTLRSGGGQYRPPPRTAEPSPRTTVRGRQVDPVSIGSVLVVPQDCYISQHGWFLIHDTYKLTQQQFSYGGTMGEFLVEICQLFRDLLSYPMLPYVHEEPIKEVLADDGGAEGNGAGIPEEGGGGDLEGEYGPDEPFA